MYSYINYNHSELDRIIYCGKRCNLMPESTLRFLTYLVRFEAKLDYTVSHNRT